MEVTARKGIGDQVKSFTEAFSEGLIYSTRKSTLIILNLKRERGILKRISKELQRFVLSHL